MPVQPGGLLHAQLLTLLRELHGTALRASLTTEDDTQAHVMTELAEQAYFYQQKLVAQEQ